MSAKIAIYGSTGFIGSRFCDLYSHCVVKIPRESNDIIEKSILYLISTTDNYNVHRDVHIDINTNLNKLMDVLVYCKNKDVVFNFVSSWFVYGDGQLPAKEDRYCNPKGFYSITKHCAENLLVSFCDTFGIKYRILRLCNVYGPNDKGVGKKKNALQYLIDEIKNNRNIDLYYGGDFIRDYMHVDDVCRAIKLCIDSAPLNDVINIGSGIPSKFIDIMNYAAKTTNYTGKFNAVEPSGFHKIVQVKDFYMCVDKLKSLGYTQTIPIEVGIDRLVK